MTKQRAFGLVEFMIGLFIGSCLITFMIRHYLSTSHHTYQTKQHLSAIYDRLLISDLIRSSIQQAGFTPCKSIRALTMSPVILPIKFKDEPEGTLEISRMSEYFSVANLREFSKNELKIDQDLNLKAKEKILIADCFHAEIKIIQALHHNGAHWTITLQNSLQYHYTPPIYVGEWLHERFFVRASSDSESALYEDINQPEVLSSQIQAMSVKLIQNEPNTLIQVELVPKQGAKWTIDAMVRA